MLGKFSVLFFLSVALVFAQDAQVRVMQITLPEAVRAALDKNFSLQERAFEPRIAVERLRSATGVFDPSLNASYKYNYNKTGDLTTNSANDVVPSPFTYANSQETSLTVGGKTPIGTTYSIGTTITADANNRRDPSYTRNNTFVGISLTQPLLKNFGTGANMAAIRIARADLAISDWTLRQEIITVITNCIHAYSELCFSLEYLNVTLHSRSLAAQLVEDNEKRASIGVMAPLDILQARADLASREENVLLAQRNVADRENALKQIVSNEVFSLLDLKIRPAAPQFPATPKPNVTRDVLKALELRPDYRQALLQIQKQNINIIYTRNQMMPRLDLVASFGLNGIDSKLGDSLVRGLGMRDTGLAGSIGAVFSIPFPNNEASGTHEAAKLRIAQLLVSLKKLEQKIIIDTDNAAGHIETMLKRIETNRLAREFSAATLDAGMARLAAGTATTFEVLQFQRDLANAEANDLRAHADYINALADYASITATTLEQNNVILDAAATSPEKTQKK